MALGLSVLVGVLVLMTALALDVLLLSFLSLLLALGLRDTARRLSRHTRLPLPAALVAVMIVLTALGWAFVTLAAPSVAAQSKELARTLPQSLERLQQALAGTEWGRTALASLPQPQEVLPRARELLGRATGVFSATFGVLANVFVLVTVTLFLAFELGGYKEAALRLVPPARRLRAREVMDEVGRTLSLWLVGRVIAMVAISVLTAVGLWVLGVPLALILALIAGLLNFIPNIGPIVALVPAGLLAMVQGPRTLLWVIVLYSAIQLIESYVLTPYIQQKAVDVPPAMLIVTQVIAGVLLGFLGLLLATPLVAAVMVLVRRLYVEDFLERETAR
jgi:predicted PurR-regulated permease PerM